MIYRIVYLFCILLFSACSAKQDLDKWLGNYAYEETPVTALAGYNMVMSWEFSITKINDRYKGTVNVNGQQTGFSLFADIKGNADRIIVTYDNLLEGPDQGLMKGDTLFILSHTAKGIITNWGNLSPRLSTTFPQKCHCFDLTGANKK